MRGIKYFQFAFCIILLVQVILFCYAEECIDSGGVANGTYINIIYPQSNSNVSLNNVDKFNFTIKSDFYGSPITTRCDYGGEIFESDCSLEIVAYVNLLNNDGSTLQDAVEFFTEYTPVTASGEKTYSFESMCKNSSICLDGKYSIDASVVYGCSTRPAEKSISSEFMLLLDFPKIIQTYPTNGMVVSSYNSEKARVSPSLDATDSANISAKKINTGTQTIDLIANPNYEISLDPGQYSWNFSVVDSFGNTNNTIINFTVIAAASSSVPIIQSFNYSSNTPNDGQIIVSNQLLINLTASDASSIREVNVIIFNSSGIVKILKDINKKNTYSFLTTDLPNGNYSFNASLINTTNSTFNLQNRNIQLSAPVTQSPASFIIPPRVSYLYPKNNSFTNSSNIDFRIKLNKKSKMNYSMDGQTSYVMNRQNDNLTFNYFFKNLSEGTHNLYLRLITEDESIVTRNISLVFTIDKTRPVIETNISSTEYKKGEPILISFNAKDSSGIVRKWYNYGEGDINYSSTKKTLAEGNYNFKLYAQDRAGNIEMKTISVLVVDSKNSLIIIVFSILALIAIIVTVYFFIRKRKLAQDQTNPVIQNNYPNYTPNQSGNI